MILNSDMMKDVLKLYNNDKSIKDTFLKALEGKLDNVIVECAYNDKM